MQKSETHTEVYEITLESNQLTREHDSQRFQEHGWSEAVQPYQGLGLTNQSQQFLPNHHQILVRCWILCHDGWYEDRPFRANTPTPLQHLQQFLLFVPRKEQGRVVILWLLSSLHWTHVMIISISLQSINQIQLHRVCKLELLDQIAWASNPSCLLFEEQCKKITKKDHAFNNSTI